MRDFRDAGAVEGARRIVYLVSRLTVLRPEKDGPLSMLRDLSLMLLAGDTPGAYDKYHELARALITCGARRVSGDSFTDYLLSLVIERENPFALMAAAGRLDEAEQLAAKSDLAALGELATLASEDIVRYCLERHRELQTRPRYAKDEISVMSTALWSGAPTGDSTEQKKEKAAPPSQSLMLPPEHEWLPWRYGAQELRGEWAADEALEEVYSRLMRTADWRSLADDIWNLFASCGCGNFLKTRVFKIKDGALAPSDVPDWLPPVSFYDAQRMAVSENVIAFMRGEQAFPMLVTGPAGVGKTTLMTDLAEDFPELRIITATGPEIYSAPDILDALRAQPLRFLLLLDGVYPDDEPLKVLLCECRRGGPPQNVLLAAASREAVPPGFFPMTVELKYPRIADFIDIVCELAEASGCESVDRAAVRSACVDFQVDAHEALTLSAATMLAQRYRIGHE